MARALIYVFAVLATVRWHADATGETKDGILTQRGNSPLLSSKGSKPPAIQINDEEHDRPDESFTPRGRAGMAVQNASRDDVAGKRSLEEAKPPVMPKTSRQSLLQYDSLTSQEITEMCSLRLPKIPGRTAKNKSFVHLHSPSDIFDVQPKALDKGGFGTVYFATLSKSKINASMTALISPSVDPDMLEIVYAEEDEHCGQDAIDSSHSIRDDSLSETGDEALSSSRMPSGRSTPMVLCNEKKSSDSPIDSLLIGLNIDSGSASSEILGQNPLVPRRSKQPAQSFFFGGNNTAGLDLPLIGLDEANNRYKPVLPTIHSVAEHAESHAETLVINREMLSVISFAETATDINKTHSPTVTTARLDRDDSVEDQSDSAMAKVQSNQIHHLLPLTASKVQQSTSSIPLLEQVVEVVDESGSDSDDYGDDCPISPCCDWCSGVFNSSSQDKQTRVSKDSQRLDTHSSFSHIDGSTGRIRSSSSLGSSRDNDKTRMLCRAVTFKGVVALKCIGLDPGRRIKHHVLEELRVMSKLAHENIIDLRGAFIEESRVWIAMELAHHGSLAHKLHVKAIAMQDKSSAVFSEDEVRAIGGALLRAIAYMHGESIVHRDVKPLNILFDRNDTLKVCDFGLATMLNARGHCVGSRQRVGSPAYMAPEVAGRRPYGAAVDLFSVGITLYELVVGRAPRFSENNAVHMDTVSSLRKVSTLFDLNPRSSLISSDLRDLLAILLHPRSSERMYAEKVLTHRFFTGPNGFTRHIPQRMLTPGEEGISLTRSFSFKNVTRLNSGRLSRESSEKVVGIPKVPSNQSIRESAGTSRKQGGVCITDAQTDQPAALTEEVHANVDEVVSNFVVDEFGRLSFKRKESEQRIQECAQTKLQAGCQCVVS